MTSNIRKISVIGQGYVGLSLAVLFANANIGQVICFDISKEKIDKLKHGIDGNKILDKDQLNNSNLFFTADENELKKADFHIVTVPTPITSDYLPDLEYLKLASMLIGRQLKVNDIVVYESTVFPGATENVCIPILEETSGLKNNSDFFVGYSPERVNVGDKDHTIENTCKVISAQNKLTLEIIRQTYQLIIKADIYNAPNIKTAEAAKLLENTQRDFNISLMNELAMVLHKNGLNAREVIKAAATKWNFLSVEPGLVGGHCISVDPYYFIYFAHHLEFDESLVVAAREINNKMSRFIAYEAVKMLIQLNVCVKHAKVAVMGFTFKENSVDIRNTRSYNLVNELQKYGMLVSVFDPLANYEEVKKIYGVELVNEKEIHDMNALIFTVKHNEFIAYSPETIVMKLTNPGLIMDIRGIWSPNEFSEFPITYWCL